MRRNFCVRVRPEKKGVFMDKQQQKTKKIEWFPRFTAKNLAVIGILSAISYLMYMVLKFPLPFVFPSFLDMQFSDLPALLGGFALGPVAGAAIIVVKCLLKMPFTGTACVGELADLIIGLLNVVPAAIFYQYHKSKKGAAVALLIGGACATVGSLLANRFLLIPFFVNEYGMGAVLGMVSALYPKINESNFYAYYLPLAVLPFNLLRCLICGVLTYLTYKPLSSVLHWEEGRKKRKKSPDLENVMIKISTSPEQTEEIAVAYAKTLSAGDVVLLDGDMGAGKTAFAKGVAKGLGIQEEVTSPTYAYMNDYDGRLFHYDCYRIESVEQAERLGLADYFDMGGICLIEWSQNIAALLPENCKRVCIRKIDENTREIEF